MLLRGLDLRLLLVVSALLVGGAWVNRIGGQVLHANGTRPSFAVASVRPSDPGSIVSAPSFAVASVRPSDPGSMISAHYVVAKPDEAEVAVLSKMSQDNRDEQMRWMVQTLLAERFQLKISFAKKEMPVYNLVVAKGGLKCPKIESVNPFAKMAAPRYGWSALPPPPPPPPGYTPPSPDEARALGQTMHMRTNYWAFWLVVTAVSHQPELEGRPVVDKTGLEGSYDCELTWSRAGSDGSGPSFFTAIQEQMGLKLEPAKGLVEIVVIDSLERPSEN